MTRNAWGMQALRGVHHRRTGFFVVKLFLERLLDNNGRVISVCVHRVYKSYLSIDCNDNGSSSGLKRVFKKA